MSRIEGFGRGQPQHGLLASQSGNGIMQMPAVSDFADVWSPDRVGAGDFCLGPGGDRIGKHGRKHFPIDQIPTAASLDPLASRVDIIPVPVFGDGRIG